MRRAIVMYLRFVTPLIHPDSGVESGFFRSSWYLRQLGCPAWIQSELDSQFNWFDENLALPGRIARHFRRRDTLQGVCWFLASAGECISRARYCAWLIGEAGLPVEVIKAAEARELIWRDGQQIVTPARRVPRAFRGRPYQAV